CVNICPSGNLVREGNTIRTTGKCVLCERCYNFCPVQAVLYMGRPHKGRRGKPYRGPVPGFKPEMLRRPR
ncbi:MAG: 4Fe-4S binding protein, partial [Spirochaetales bacterium]|nr:4Fe-4S binding protein [Spirochaetales bacterium]